MHKEMDNFIDQAIYNSYMIIAGEFNFRRNRRIRKVFCIIKIKK